MVMLLWTWLRWPQNITKQNLHIPHSFIKNIQEAKGFEKYQSPLSEIWNHMEIAPNSIVVNFIGSG